MSANSLEDILKRMTIIEKLQMLSWHTDIDFGDGLIVNVDKSGDGVEQFRITHADIDDVYGYPVSSFYGPEDTDSLSSWGCGNVPTIEKDSLSEDLERDLDDKLRQYEIHRDNPVMRRYHPYI